MNHAVNTSMGFIANLSQSVFIANIQENHFGKENTMINWTALKKYSMYFLSILLIIYAIQNAIDNNAQLSQIKESDLIAARKKYPGMSEGALQQMALIESNSIGEPKR
jgi:hypothetical protein